MLSIFQGAIYTIWTIKEADSIGMQVIGFGNNNAKSGEITQVSGNDDFYHQKDQFEFDVPSEERHVDNSQLAS